MNASSRFLPAISFGKISRRYDRDFLDVSLVPVMILYFGIGFANPRHPPILDALKQSLVKSPSLDDNRVATKLHIQIAGIGIPAKPLQIRIVEAGAHAIAELKLEEVLKK